MNQDRDCDNCRHDWALNLNARDVKVCEIICNSGSPVGFNEIRRRTGIHQEVLSRILRRLVFSGNIEKVKSKYDRCCSSSQ